MSTLTPLQQALDRVFGAVPGNSTYIIVAYGTDGRFLVSEFEPDVEWVRGLLRDIVCRRHEDQARDCDIGFTIPVFSDYPCDDDTYVVDPVIDRFVRELRDIGNCRLALAWQPPDTTKAHVRVVNYSVVDAFRGFRDLLADADNWGLEISH